MLQVIPQQLCYNAGLDATDLLNRLRHRHAKGELWVGVNIQQVGIFLKGKLFQENLTDNMAACVWEPALVKRNAISAASEAACLILGVDETVKNPKASGKLEQ